MTLYKNSRIQSEMDDDDMIEQIEEINNEPEENLPQEEKTYKKRFGDQTRWFQEKEANYKAEIDNLKKQMEKISRGEIRPPKTEAEIIEWEETYPDFAQIMDSRVKRIVQAELKDVKVQTNQLKVERAKNDLRKRHPDLDDLVKPNSEFMKWLAKQPQKHIDALTKSLDVDDADFVIDKFKTQVLSKKKKSGDSFEDNDTARAVRTKSSVPVIDDDGGEYLYSESQIQKMTGREYDAHEEKIAKAWREGKVLMDMTGGARV